MHIFDRLHQSAHFTSPHNWSAVRSIQYPCARRYTTRARGLPAHLPATTLSLITFISRRDGSLGSGVMVNRSVQYYLLTCYCEQSSGTTTSIRSIQSIHLLHRSKHALFSCVEEVLLPSIQKLQEQQGVPKSAIQYRE